MADNREDRIRARAHEIWVNEGQPDGEEQRHWEQAATEIDAADKPVAKKPAATKALAAKKVGAGAAIAKTSKDAKKPAKKG